MPPVQECVPQLLERHRAVLDEHLPLTITVGQAGPSRAVNRRGLLHDRDFSPKFGLRTGGGLKVLLSPLSHGVVVVERDGQLIHAVLPSSVTEMGTDLFSDFLENNLSHFPICFSRGCYR